MRTSSGGTQKAEVALIHSQGDSRVNKWLPPIQDFVNFRG